MRKHLTALTAPIVAAIVATLVFTGPAIAEFVNASFDGPPPVDDGTTGTDAQLEPESGEPEPEPEPEPELESEAGEGDLETGSDDGDDPAPAGPSPSDSSDPESDEDGPQTAEPPTVSSGAIEYREGSATRTVELPPSDGRLARVDVFQEANYAVRLVFVGFEDVALWWQTPAEAVMSMSVDRYPQQVLEQRHGVPVSTSDPLVQAAVAEVMAFFQPGGAGGGSLRIEESTAAGRSVRVLFDNGHIDVVFGGGWESGRFVYDSKAWALSDLVDGRYVESILTSRFGASVDEVRPLLATARGLVSGG